MPEAFVLQGNQADDAGPPAQTVTALPPLAVATVNGLGHDRSNGHLPTFSRSLGRLPGGGAGLRVPPFVMRPRGATSGGMTGQLPLRTCLELGALDGAVPSARLHARYVLGEWGLAALADDAELVVSELVTNGVQASRAMTHAAIRLRLGSDRAMAVIEVWDASPRPPVRMVAAEDAEGGRGLLLVETISTRWGWFPGAHDGTTSARRGKVVWAILRLSG